ncbi:hypothetical protein [Actinacidiphila oryziradicis]|uniref:Uncharacterized protein n=1 Tax=Actinacidiphila oryziradicis TaxID=2571141 RepID=A0A4U0SUB0_9ACTN|nr:hypothetical protein [Actinacidiphila oryziradicis]TKA12111.1 hypothetical protein FCI23_07360 [Actinacidiphila oryziradicis]
MPAAGEGVEAAADALHERRFALAERGAGEPWGELAAMTGAELPHGVADGDEPLGKSRFGAVLRARRLLAAGPAAALGGVGRRNETAARGDTAEHGTAEAGFGLGEEMDGVVREVVVIAGGVAGGERGSGAAGDADRVTNAPRPW